MPLLSVHNMDLLLVLFAVLYLGRAALFRDRVPDGFKWLAAGGLVILVPVGLSAVNWSLLGMLEVFRTVDTWLSLLGGLLILAGSVKTLMELFSK